MVPEYQLLRYGRWDARLLRLYPEPFRERFRESMERTLMGREASAMKHSEAW